MSRKRLTQRFPWLLPLRRVQRRACFYLSMALDQNRYARRRSSRRLPFLLYETRCPMINRRTGFDLRYQENKVHNLRLAAKKLSGLLIAPGETFSFWQALRGADREEPYREGLAEIDGRLTVEKGGGLCMLSNLLFWLLLHTELTVLERHGHREKDFPEPESAAAAGTDAAVAEGWLDLKLKNNTDRVFQLEIAFDEGDILGRVYADRPPAEGLLVENGPARYFRRGGEIFQEVPVIRRRLGPGGERRELLYVNRCRVGYPLPEEITIEEERQ